MSTGSSCIKFWLIIISELNAIKDVREETKVFMVVGSIPVRLFADFIELHELRDWRVIVEHAPKSMLAALVVGSLYENAFFFDKWKSTIKQNEELKDQHVRTQFEVLQNQMSPHFLFNSLNALTTLIAENQGTAIEFTEKLSEVYRNILQTKDKELVKAQKEPLISKTGLANRQIVRFRTILSDTSHSFSIVIR